MANYELRVNTVSETKKEIYESDLILIGKSKEQLTNEMFAGIQNDVTSKVIAEFASHGQNVWVQNFNFQPIWSERQAPSIAFPHNLVTILRLKVIVDYSIYSNSAFSESPLPLWVLPAIKWLVPLAIKAVLAYIIIVEFFKWMDSMTHSETRIEEWGWVVNPDTGEQEWKLVETVTEKSPDYIAILIVGFAILAIIFLFMAFRSGGSTSINVGGRKIAGIKRGK